MISLQDEMYIERPKTRSVSFCDSDVNLNRTIELSNDNETDALVRKERRARKISRPRMTSVFHMTDNSFPGGIITRANYMTRCFQTAWEQNTADAASLQMILWNGETSKQSAWKAALSLVLQWIFPVLPLIFFIKSTRDGNAFKTLAWIIFVAELAWFIWHLAVLLILERNKRNWKKAWFTFEVPRGTIGLVDSGESNELTLFHFSANIRFIKATFATIARLHTISKHEQEILEQNMQVRDLEKSEIILYTDDFFACYNQWPKYMTAGLLVAVTFIDGSGIVFCS